MKNSKFLILSAKNGERYFNLVAPNGQIILSSETYKSQAALKNGIRVAIKAAKTAKIVDKTKHKRK